MVKTLNPALTLGHGESLVERGKLLGRLNAERGRLPLSRIEQDYVFDLGLRARQRMTHGRL